MSAKDRLSIVLAIGWTAGLLAQLWVGLASGYADIFPPQMLLGLALCFGAGLRAHAVNPLGTWRTGARAGATMMLLLVVSYFALTAIILPPSPDPSGETWWTLLLEAPFWIGIPFGSAALLGAIGWRIGSR